MAEITPSPQEQDHTNSAILSRTEASANTVITSDSDTIQSEPALDQQGSTSGGLIEEVEAEENAEGDGGEDGEEEEAEEEEDEEGSSELDEDRDIRVEFGDCLDGELGSPTSISFNKTYDDAPNPVLRLQNVGGVGLPLSDRDADIIKAHAVQAPFGMGERTLVDKSVRDTWEMDGSLVAFRGAKWAAFMDRVVKEVCGTLGVNFAASQPRCELYKLLLYETGSHFLPHVDTEKADGMFATIIVVLPSQFSGGAAHLSHGNISRVYDCSAASLDSTTVMAWYTDVTHEIKPITSGYRLALSYNLIHTTTSLRPALSSADDLVQKLREVLHVWDRDCGVSGYAPEKIVYLLDHKYSQANLRASALKGQDAQKVAILSQLASEFDFHLGFASVVCKLVGSAEGDGVYDNHYDPYDEDSDYGGYGGRGDLEMGDIDEREMFIEEFVDIDGKLISHTLSIDEETETFPEDLAGIVEDGPVDDEEYEGYMGNYAGSLSRWYRSTVLVIWPDWTNFAIQYGDENIERAYTNLADITTTVPRDDDVSLAKFVLDRAHKSPAKAAQAVCRVARLWNDPSLWARAIASCSQGKGFILYETIQLLFDGILHFSFDKVQPSLDILLKEDTRNAGRFAFLDKVETWVTARNAPELASLVLPWVATARESVIATLTSPSEQDTPTFISLAVKRGGLEYLTNVIVPRIKATATPDFLRHLVVKAYDEARFTDSAETKTQALSGIMSDAISRTQFNVPQKTQPYPTYYAHQHQENTNLANAKAFFRACFGRFDALLDVVIAKVTDVQSLAAHEVQKHVKEVLLPMLQVVAEMIKPGADVPPSVTKLLRLVFDEYIKVMTADPKSTSRESIRALVSAATLPGGPELLMSHVMPKIESLPLLDTALRGFMEELKANTNRITFPLAYNGPKLPSLIVALSKKYAAVASLQNVQMITSALELCLSLLALEACTVLIKRIVDTKLLKPQYVNTYKMLDGFSPAFQTIVLAWMEKVLGTKPRDDGSSHLARLSSWACSCTECTEVKRFLTTSPERTTYLHRIGAPRCKHVEGFLNSYGRTACIWKTAQTTPRSFQVTKADAIYKPVLWNATQKTGQAILKTVSENEVELRRILGAHYATIVTIIRGRAPPDLPPLAQNTLAGSSRPAGTVASDQAPQAKKRKIASGSRPVIDLT